MADSKPEWVKITADTYAMLVGVGVLIRVDHNATGAVALCFIPNAYIAFDGEYHWIGGNN